MQRFKNFFSQTSVLLCALIAWFWIPIANAIVEVIEVAVEALYTLVQTGMVVASIIAAIQHNDHHPHMPSRLVTEMEQDLVIQHVVDKQKTSVEQNKVAVISRDDLPRAIHDLAVAQKNLEKSIPSEVLADAAISSAHILEAIKSQDLNITLTNIDISGISQKLIARHKALIEAQCKESVKWYEMQSIPGGVRVRGIDQNWYVQVTARPRVDNTPASYVEKEYRQYCKQIFRLALANNPAYAAYIKETVSHTESLLHLANSDDVGTRIYARLALSEMKLQGPVVQVNGELVQVPVPFQDEFDYMLAETGKRWYAKDGQLISVEKTPDLHDFSSLFIDKVVHNIPEFQGTLRHVDTLSALSKETRRERFLKWYFGKSSHVRAGHNKANEVVKDCIIACKKLDIDKANQAYEEYMIGVRGGRFSQEMYEPLRQIMNEAKAQHAVEQARIFNEYGIYRAYTNDPVYTQLSTKSLQDIKNNKVEKDAVNHVLLLRGRTKEAMKRAWDIRCEPGSAVDRALYSIMDRDFYQPKVLAETINDIVKSQDPATRQQIVDAFYAQNGAIKDFSDWKTVQSLSLPQTILKPEYDEVRYQLNNLLCLEHQKLSANQTINLQHAYAYTYLDHALKTDDVELKAAYLYLYDHMADLAQTDKESLFRTMPCLVGHFEHPAPEATQKVIAVVGASLAEVEKQLIQCGTSELDAKARERLTQELVRQLDGLRRAHELNAAGSCNPANKILAEMFSNPDDGFVWSWNRPLVYAHHAVEKIRGCIDEHSEIVVDCGTSLVADVLSNDAINQSDVQKKLGRVAAIHAQDRNVLFNEQEPDAEKDSHVSPEERGPDPDGPDDEQEGVKVDEGLDLSEYDSSSIDLEYLQEIYQEFKGTLKSSQDSPLHRILKGCKKNALPGHKQMVRGALFELRVSQYLEAQGKNIVDINKKFDMGNGLREFDIILEDTWIECKSVDWMTKANTGDKVFGQIKNQSNIAKYYGKNYEVYSEFPLTDMARGWFQEHGIRVIELLR